LARPTVQEEDRTAAPVVTAVKVRRPNEVLSQLAPLPGLGC
jgi:hypothetical protein